MTELLIKNILSEILFGNRICESFDDQYIVDYMYKKMLCEKLLYGEPVSIPELRKLLHKKILNFEFIKLDGEVRPAKGTTMMKYVPQTAQPKGIRPSSKKVATFYDLEKKDWRSVSQRSKEIVLKKDEETGKPVVMVKDNPKGGAVAIQNKKPEPPIEVPIEEPIEEPTNEPLVQPDITVDDQPLDQYEEPGKTDVEVTKVKPIKSIEQTTMFHFINPKTGASQDIEMTPKEVVKELKKRGSDWNLADENEFQETKDRIKSYVEEKPDELNIGDKRNYLNRQGKNVEIEIVGEDPYGGLYAKGPNGAEFKIPASKMQNIGQSIKGKPKTKLGNRSIINKEADLENIDASEI